MTEDQDILRQQVQYYRARAPEYDQWFRQQGRYDQGAEHTDRWETEVASVRQVLHDRGLHGSVLELACGTGWWTAELARHDVTITAVDTSPEVLRINKERVRSHRVRYVRANIFDWSLSARFDTIFFGFWLTHVPPRRFESFWKLVETSLTPDGRVYFVDNRWYPEYRRGHGPGTEKVGAGIPGSWIASRELNDGRRFEIVKVFYEAGELRRRLEMLGWTGQIVETPRFFIWGDLARRTGAA